MPIGKNSIKRVTNNGYSKVTSSAPDMENSVALEENKEIKETPKTQPAEAKKKAPKAPTARKSAGGVSNKKGTVKKTVTAKKETAKVEKTEENTSYVNLGRDLPTYLL